MSDSAVFTAIYGKWAAQETLKRLFCEKCPSVWIRFCEAWAQGKSECFWQHTLIAVVGELASRSQGSCPDCFSTRSHQPARSHAAVAQWKHSSTGFPQTLALPFLILPIHKVNQETGNYGALEIAESCAELNSEAVFPSKWAQCLVHRKLSASHCFPDL